MDELCDRTRELVECCVCFEKYDLEQKLPKYLQCHHTFCCSCLEDLHDKGNSTISCPMCRTPTFCHSVNALASNPYPLAMIEFRCRRQEPDFYSTEHIIEHVDANVGSNVFRLGNFNRTCAETCVDRGTYRGRATALFKVSKQCSAVKYEELRARVNTFANESIPNIATFFGVDHNDDFWYLPCANFETTLGHYVQQEPELNLADKVNWARQLANGLSYLHSRQYVHKDINPSSCLRYANGHMKLTAPSLIRNSLDSLEWMAPELHLSLAQFTLASDTWSFGCLLYYIFTWGMHPFGNGITRSQRIARILNNKYSLSELKEKTGKIRYEILVFSCLAFDATVSEPAMSRPNMAVIFDEISNLIPPANEFNLPTWIRRPLRWLTYKIKST